jgi:hypothetical protein
MTGALVVNEKLVCVGRYPKKEQVLGWLQAALELVERRKGHDPIHRNGP